MKMEAVHSEWIGKYLIEIYQDTDTESPREWDNLGTMVCFHRRYDLGDKHDYDSDDYSGWEEMKEAIIKQEKVHTILPLYLYDHSGITISTGPFSCNWDSGQIGWIFVSKEKVKEEGMDESKVEDYLKGEVKTYDQYLTGDVYGYRIYEVITCSLGHDHEEDLHSCGGFYGEDYCLQEAKDIVNHLIEKESVVS